MEQQQRICQLSTTFKKLLSISIGNNILTPLNGCIFTNRTIGMTFSIGTNCSIRTNGPLELPFTQPDYMRNSLKFIRSLRVAFSS